MRFLLSIMLLIPTACLALGPENEEFVGVSNDGKLTIIGFVSDPEEWTGNNWIYGLSSSPKFRYCWINEVPVDPSNPQFSPRQSTHFVCAPERGAKPTVFYKRAYYHSSKKTGLRYREAMADFAKARKAGYGRTRDEKYRDAINEYYVCDKGCNDSMPTFIFEVGF